MHAHWFVPSCVRALEPRRLANATPGVTLACLVFGKGEERPTSGRSPRTGCNRRRLQRTRIPAEFRARVIEPLGASGALREGLKTTSGGRLASSAGV